MNEKFAQLLARHKESDGTPLSLLQKTQEAFGYIPKEAVHYYAGELDIPASRFYGIATFYAQFHLRPRGRNIITACCGTACHVRGAGRIIDSAVRELGLKDDNDTTDDNEFTIEKLACLGACSMAPVVSINGKIKARATADDVTREIRKLKRRQA
jgi:NADH-quinone oxidoreductase subunit E